MLDTLNQFFASVPSEIYVFIISVLPIIELRGAIPVGAALGLPFYTNYALAVAGNMLPIPFILLFIPRILDFMARFRIFRPVVDWLRRRASSKSARVLGRGKEQTDSADTEATVPSNAENAQSTDNESQNVRMSGAIFFALMLFVAIPLPATGAWTGSLVAALFDLPKKYSLLAIFLGVLISGTIMTLASYGVLEFLSILI